MRMTKKKQLIVRALLKDPARELEGLGLCAETGLLPGMAYVTLLRLANAGWVTARWEDIPRTEKRPARRFYRLTRAGAVQARAAMDPAVPGRGRARRGRWSMFRVTRPGPGSTGRGTRSRAGNRRAE